MHRSIPGVTPLDTSLVEQLLTPAAYDHPVTDIKLVETHISWVLLTDKYAYKIKKPLQLDFLDFSDLEKRHYYCKEELRLNRQWASEIYLDVVTINDHGGRARIGGDGPVIEYAVKMRRFSDEMRLDFQLERGELSADDMRELGSEIATRHMRAEVVGRDLRQRVQQTTISQMYDNFSALEGQVDANYLSPLLEWTETQLKILANVINTRIDSGYARICHGDLHLANLVRLEDGIRAFDCIEFNEDLRHMDTVCDYAFLVMDLVAKDRADLAAHFINRYLERCGDYPGVVLLDLYFVYRCLVRAKVASIVSQEQVSPDAQRASIAEAERYCHIALQQIRKPTPVLIIMYGLSGTGKSWVSERLMADLPAIRLRSDAERKRMHGLAEDSHSGSDIAGGIYENASSQAVYEYLLQTAITLLNAGHDVILDATFLRSTYREAALLMADSGGFAAVIVDVRAPDTELLERLARREQDSADVSEAGAGVLDFQRSIVEPLAAAEIDRSIVFNNDGRGVEKLSSSIRQYRERARPQD